MNSPMLCACRSLPVSVAPVLGPATAGGTVAVAF
jgi:hypothetical protein